MRLYVSVCTKKMARILQDNFAQAQNPLWFVRSRCCGASSFPTLLYFIDLDTNIYVMHRCVVSELWEIAGKTVTAKKTEKRRRKEGGRREREKMIDVMFYLTTTKNNNKELMPSSGRYCDA